MGPASGNDTSGEVCRVVYGRDVLNLLTMKKGFFLCASLPPVIHICVLLGALVGTVGLRERVTSIGELVIWK